MGRHVSRQNWRFLVLAAGAGVLSLLGGIALSAVTSDDVESNRRLLREIRANNPEYYVRLQRRYEHFRAIPVAEQERVRQLDRDLFDKEPQTQSSLMRALEEYVAWLTRLSEADRKRVLSAVSRDERLRIIQELRLEQWVDHLPAAQKEELRREPNEQTRQATIEKWRRQEIAWRQDWSDIRHYTEFLKFKGPKLPFRDEKFQAEVRAFVDKRLKPMLSQEELTVLQIAADDQNPSTPLKWPRTVFWLSERHPVLGLEPRFQSFAYLPKEYQSILAKMPAPARLQAKENKWPDYPLEVMATLRRRAEKGKDFREPKEQLGPSKAEDFPANVQNFIRNSLEKALTEPAEKERLAKAHGHWPEYPLTLIDLSRKHNLAIPELMLPGAPQEWEHLRLIGRPIPFDK
jgi:hypothetical protein